MGSGQSRNRNVQYPMPQPMYPSVYGPPPPFVPYGYGQPYPQGMVPQGTQFAPNYLQQPPVNFMPPQKYRKSSKRPQSERFVGGLFSGGGMPQPEGL